MVFPEIALQDKVRFSDASKPQTHIVKAGHGFAFEVSKGEHFRVVDLYGVQVTDFAAWVSGTKLVEKLSMSHTRLRLGGVQPAIGECLYSNVDRPMFRVVEDTVKMHDMTFPSCYPELYERRGLKGHRSCATNIAEVMGSFGMRSYLEVTDPFNIFQNTPNYTLKPLCSSKPGDYIEFEALVDSVCAVSSCPYDMDEQAGGKVTDVAIVTKIDQKSASWTQQSTNTY